MLAAQDRQEQPYPTGVSLYVGDLNLEVTEGDLFQFFGGEAVVTSARICRDVTSKRSLGYGYVNFRSVEDAKHALEAHNYSIIKDRPCRLMWSSRDSTKRKSTKGNLFIKNIDKTVDTRTIYQAFVEFGDILSFKIATDDFGNSKGYGFIHFSSEEEALSVCEKVNGILFKGKKLHVCPFVPRKDRGEAAKEHLFNNVFVKNFIKDLTKEKLLEKFSQYGKINSTFFPEDEEKKLKGYGFICFDKPECAIKATKELHDSELPSGEKLYVVRSMKKTERAQELMRARDIKKRERWAATRFNNCYVKNLPDDMDDEGLKTTFSRFGEITSAKVMVDENGNSKKFGFVCFTKDEHAKEAVRFYTAASYDKKSLYVAIAQSKDERRYQLSFDFSSLKSSSGVSQLPMVPAHKQNQFSQYPAAAGAVEGVVPNDRRYRTVADARVRAANNMYVPNAMQNAPRMMNMPQNFQATAVGQGKVRPHMQPGMMPQNQIPRANARYAAAQNYSAQPTAAAASAEPVQQKLTQPAAENTETNGRNFAIPTLSECLEGNSFKIPSRYYNDIFDYLCSEIESRKFSNSERIAHMLIGNRDVLTVLTRSDYLNDAIFQASELLKGKK